MSDVSTGNARAMSYPDRLKLLKLEFDLQYVKVEDVCFLVLRQLDIAYGSLDRKEQSECYILLVKKLPNKWKELYKTPPLLAGDTVLLFTENCVGDFIRNMSQIRKCLSSASEAAGASIVYSAATRCSSIDGDRIQKRTATKDPAVLQLSKEEKTANKAEIVCYGCGNAGHVL